MKKEITTLLILALVVTFASFAIVAAQGQGNLPGTPAGNYGANSQATNSKTTVSLENNPSVGTLEVTFEHKGEKQTVTGVPGCPGPNGSPTVHESLDVTFSDGNSFRAHNGEIQWSNNGGQTWTRIMKLDRTVIEEPAHPLGMMFVNPGPTPCAK